MDSDEGLLPEVAHEIRWDYQRLRNAVMRGECAGRLVFGRWVVSRESARRLRDAQEAQAEFERRQAASGGDGR